MGDHAGVAGEAPSDCLVLTLASLNTMGLPILHSDLRRRYKTMGAAFERSGADLVLCQEVVTYYHLARLRRFLPSYGAYYQRSAAGPAGGLVTFSKNRPLAVRYRAFPLDCSTGLGAAGRARARMKGSLTAIFGDPGELAVVNTHLLANVAGDWSAGSRAYQVQSAQLEALRQVVRSLKLPVIAAGDFNMPGTTPEFSAFLGGTGLTDVFGGACPPTIRSSFLPRGATAHCIDFILGSVAVEVKGHELLLGDDCPDLAGFGPVSDHLGLFATVTVANSR